MESGQRDRQSALAIDLGLGANAVLAGVKTTVGATAPSPALLADGINSLADVVYYVVVRVLTVLARQPADDEHPYGHERLESIGALVAGSFVFATGLGVFLSAGHRTIELLGGADPGPVVGALPLWIAAATILLKLLLWAFTRRVGARTSNPAVGALAFDHRNDALAALAVLAGIAGARQGWPWLDPAAAGVVALVVIHAGVSILRSSSSDLMGGQPGAQSARQITRWIAEVPGVVQVQQLRAHSFGPYLVLNVTVAVDGTITVAAGDAIADEVERVLHERVEFLRAVHVHYHPVGRRPPGAREARSPSRPPP